MSREHLAGVNCWCEPRVVFVGRDGGLVWVHDTPKDPAPLAVIAEAIRFAREGS